MSVLARSFLLVTLLALAPQLWAQDIPEALLQPNVETAELERGLRPLYVEEITGVANLLMARLKDKVVSLNAAETSGNIQAATTLRNERGGIVARLNLVIDALEAKSGDASKYRNYMAGAIAGLEVDIADTGAAMETVLAWAKSPEGGIRWGKNIAFFIVTIFGFMFLSRFAGGLVKRTLRVSRLDISDILADFFVKTTRKLTSLVGLVIALSMLEVNVMPLLTAFGVVGFILGFALQETLANFAAGLMILLYRPYDIGDFVTAGGITGTVASMSLVSTTFKTPDNQIELVPNGKIWGDVITNVNGSDTRRVDLVFGIGYSDDVAKAERVLEEIVASHELILKDPAPSIRVTELADSSVNFICRPWTKTSDRWDVYCDLTRTVKDRFDAEGISIPFPQTDVHVHQVSE